MTFHCSMCPCVSSSFSDALGHFLDHIDRGEYVTDWIELPESLVEEKK